MDKVISLNLVQGPASDISEDLLYNSLLQSQLKIATTPCRQNVIQRMADAIQDFADDMRCGSLDISSLRRVAAIILRAIRRAQDAESTCTVLFELDNALLLALFELISFIRSTPLEYDDAVKLAETLWSSVDVSSALLMTLVDYNSSKMVLEQETSHYRWGVPGIAG